MTSTFDQENVMIFMFLRHTDKTYEDLISFAEDLQSSVVELAGSHLQTLRHLYECVSLQRFYSVVLPHVGFTVSYAAGLAPLHRFLPLPSADITGHISRSSVA